MSAGRSGSSKTPCSRCTVRKLTSRFRRDRRHLALGRFDAHARLQARDHMEVVSDLGDATRGGASQCLAGQDPKDTGVTRSSATAAERCSDSKVSRHDADDGERLPIDDDVASDERRIGTVAPSPESFRNHHNRLGRRGIRRDEGASLDSG